MSGHSPIPWSVNYGNDIHDSGCDLVAAVHGTTATQEKANVALIAAAPDLLEALRLMVAIYREGSTANEPRAIRDAIAAIKKAEGRTND